MTKATKRIFSWIFTFLFLASPLFATNIMPAGMQNLAEAILGIFTSFFMQVILAIFLCGAAVAYAFNKDNEKIKRNAIAIGVSAGILVGAQAIVKAIWNASGG